MMNETAKEAFELAGDLEHTQKKLRNITSMYGFIFENINGSGTIDGYRAITNDQINALDCIFEQLIDLVPEMDKEVQDLLNVCREERATEHYRILT